MSALHTQPSWLVRGSVALYRALLLLYPARFRGVYGAQMAQVFRASCGRACREGGPAALARLWLRTLRDLLVTVIAERYEEDIVMEGRSLNRAAGLAGLIGGALLLVYALMDIIEIVSQPFERAVTNSFDPVLSLVNWAQTLLVPLSWACVFVGLLGLYALLARRRGPNVWLAGALALLGAGLGFLGSLSLTVAQWHSSLAWDLGTAHWAQMSGEQLPYLGALDVYGRLLIGLALLATPLLYQRSAPLKTVTAIIEALGLMALVPYLYLAIAIANYFDSIPNYGVYPALPRYPITLPLPFDPLLGIAYLEIAFAVIWGVGWLLLGVRFLRGGQPAAARPAPAPALSY